VIQRPAHGRPRDQLDALGAGLGDVFLSAEGRQRLRLVLNRLGAPVVEARVDQPGPGPGELVRHAAGAEDRHAYPADSARLTSVPITRGRHADRPDLA
jgi:hypothetical protein